MDSRFVHQSDIFRDSCRYRTRNSAGSTNVLEPVNGHAQICHGDGRTGNGIVWNFGLDFFHICLSRLGILCEIFIQHKKASVSLRESYCLSKRLRVFVSFFTRTRGFVTALSLPTASS